MTLQLTGRDEPQDMYKEFPGRNTEQMPILRKEGYDLISVAGIIDRRLFAPEDVIEAWRLHYFDTSDGSGCGGDGSALISLGSPSTFRSYTESPLYNGALILSDEQWEEEKAKDNSMHLPADKVRDVHGKGFIFKNGIWQPETTLVGDVIYFLTQGRDLKNYLNLVSDRSKSKNINIMNVYLNQTTKNGKSTMRSVVVSRTDYGSGVGDGNLDGSSGRLAGVAPEAPVARENGGPYRSAGRTTEEVLEERLAEVLSPFDQFVATINRPQYDGMKLKALRELKDLFKDK